MSDIITSRNSSRFSKIDFIYSKFEYLMKVSYLGFDLDEISIQVDQN